MSQTLKRQLKRVAFLLDRKLRQTRHFNGGKDSKKFPKVLALAHYES